MRQRWKERPVNRHCSSPSERWGKFEAEATALADWLDMGCKKKGVGEGEPEIFLAYDWRMVLLEIGKILGWTVSAQGRSSSSVWGTVRLRCGKLVLWSSEERLCSEDTDLEVISMWMYLRDQPGRKWGQRRDEVVGLPCSSPVMRGPCSSTVVSPVPLMVGQRCKLRVFVLRRRRAHCPLDLLMGPTFSWKSRSRVGWERAWGQTCTEGPGKEDYADAVRSVHRSVSGAGTSYRMAEVGRTPCWPLRAKGLPSQLNSSICIF